MSRLLDAVRRATTRRREADQAYSDAIQAAHSEHSYREIAEAAELSYEGVRYRIGGDRRKKRDTDA